MAKFRVAVIASDERGVAVLNMLDKFKRVEVVAVCQAGERCGSFSLVEQNVYVVKELAELPSLDIHAIIDTSGMPHIRRQMMGLNLNGVAILEGQATELLQVILQEEDKVKGIQGELSTILNSVQEAIEVVNEKGVIKYVNPAFTNITGIEPTERIGNNIYDVSPEGALAKVLENGEHIFGHRTTVGGSNAEVISNASPIIVDGETRGAVVVFNHFTDIMKLMDKLQQSTTIIENLSDKFGEVTTSKYTFKDILGNNQDLKRCMQIGERAAKSTSTVLLTGESGTGKELFAHAVHHVSGRRDKPFIKVNCAAIPENLLESEFFGYVKGAFTGAIKSRIGKFELAHGGTIFLDEIGDMNLILQGKLLRVLQEMEFERVGGNETIKVDVRVIAATNRDLHGLIRQGKFREDLYYRLNVVEIPIPALRYRKEDLPLLTNNLIIKLNRKLGKKVKGLSQHGEEVLFSYDWPGNIRELENVVERVMVTVDDEILTKSHFLQYVSQLREAPEKDIELIPIDQMEQILIKKAMAKFGGTVEGKRRAARALNISLATLYNKLKKVKNGSF
ncbi:MAG: PAS domain-containing protein [Firmicutes bacterium]|nr:PAS domain-containing protein [Bacillota bacterium]